MGMGFVLQPGANGRGKAQGDSFQPRFGGTPSLDTIAHLYPPDLLNNHRYKLPDSGRAPALTR